jgi:uncharacterized membrane protein YphA (DoxX/SURF4 family)
MTDTASKGSAIAYWITTGLAGAAFLTGGAFDAMGGPEVTKILTHLGYPAYFATIIGVWKLLGGIAILAPRLPRIKEWAYAGMLFDLTGAAFSHAAVGDGVKEIGTPLALLVLVVASWWLRPPSRRL